MRRENEETNYGIIQGCHLIFYPTRQSLILPCQLLTLVESKCAHVKIQRVKYLLQIAHLPFRSQTLNQADALEKIRSAVRLALQPSKPTPTEEEVEKIREDSISIN